MERPEGAESKALHLPGPVNPAERVNEMQE